MKPYQINTLDISHIQIVDVYNIPEPFPSTFPIFMVVCTTGLVGYYLENVLPLQNEFLTILVKDEDINFIDKQG